MERRVELSGLQKQDYMLKSALHQRIVVVGNERLFRSLHDLLHGIKSELERIDDASEVRCEHLLPLRTAVEVLEGFETEK